MLLQFKSNSYSDGETLNEFHHLIQNQVLANYWADEYLGTLDDLLRKGSVSSSDVIGLLISLVSQFTYLTRLNCQHFNLHHFISLQ